MRQVFDCAIGHIYKLGVLKKSLIKVSMELRVMLLETLW